MWRVCITIIATASISVGISASDLSLSALYRVENIVQIAKKVDDKCIDNEAKTCERVGYWKVKYKALDPLVPRQYHEVMMSDKTPQIGSVTQLTLKPTDKK